MKRFFLLVVLSFFSIAYSQPSNNRFDQEDNASRENVMTNTNSNSSVGDMQPDGNDGPVDPPAPLPIDEYIPLLGFAALVLIFYKYYKNRKHV